MTQDDATVDVLAPDEAAAAPQVGRISSYRAVRVVVALVALLALGVITLALGVAGPNKWILISLSAGGAAGFVFGAIATQILQPAPTTGAAGGAAPPSPWEQFLRELDRCRRYDLTFTLARMPAGSPQATRNGRGRRTRREQAPDLGAGLRPHLRSTDLTWTQGPYVYVLLTGIGGNACEQLFARIESRSPGLIPSSGVTYSCFPDDGLTSNALLAALGGQTIEPVRSGGRA